VRLVLTMMVVALSGTNPPVVGGGSQQSDEPKPLAPGEYRLSLTATDGSQKGGAVNDTATLRPASAGDRSPRTGERAKDDGNAQILLYGWTGADLSAVGAPLCPDGVEPPPDSRDPVYPGLLVTRVPFGLGGPFTGTKLVTTILVATVANLRNGEHWTDGCGFGMYVLRMDGDCFIGDWKEWGLRRDGRGSFRLCPK
jgi:hypothetical protein